MTKKRIRILAFQMVFLMMTVMLGACRSTTKTNSGESSSSAEIAVSSGINTSGTESGSQTGSTSRKTAEGKNNAGVSDSTSTTKKKVVDYGANYRSDMVKANQEYLAGAVYISFEGYKFNGVDYKKGMKVLHNLGVKCIRNSMFTSLLFPSLDSRNEEDIKLMHSILAEAARYDIQIIGEVSGNYNKTGFNDKIPKRDITQGSYYLEWLSNYEKMFYTIVKEFPEITYWEIQNEPNNAGELMEGGTYTFREKADMFTDMLLYASRGIHKANPDAISVMGGITETTGLGSGKNKQFLELLYDNIFSGKWPSTYPDDYFQVAAWHPYTFYYFDRESFVKYNNEIYNIIKKREGKDKKVFLTEFGFSDGMAKQEDIAKWTMELFKTLRQDMKYVESMCYFREFNDLNDLSWGAELSLTMYGLFYDPNPDHNDLLNNVRQIPGAPKPVAYAFQKAAGGKGDLTIMVPDKYKSQLK
ncbi:MAG: cellulase family glycosylhydrolase [Clostridiales bacterium]|nr:cellulase family glycosylhydrolase [Clostridiales bacterium]